MEKLKISLHSLNKALKTLDSSLITLQKAKDLKIEEFILASQDSVIQKFEYCYEGFWNF